ncbi:MAG: cobalamin 5'-phosphate synthase [Chloroflexi bacterium RBG_13_51_18]|nr:MAG: cobalamin 5'-phosphate synthase [Chloroflexi bacterium RBG_13_51_18]
MPKREYRKENRKTTSFLAAIQLLTSIPIPLKSELTQEQLGRATAYFPIVGLIIGGILAGLNWVFNLVMPTPVTNALLIVSLVLLTGAMHLDGLSDTCDGMAGHKTVEERWKVMHDSHAGAFGVVGIILVLLVQYAVLNNIPADKMTAVLLFMPAASRWAMVYAIYAFPYARPTGLGTAYKAATHWPQFIFATIITLAAAGALFPLLNVTGFLLIGGILIITTALAFYFKHKFAGLTGDTYGAINEIAQATALIGVVIIAKVGAGLIG